MPLKALRAALRDRDVSYEGCVEKAELVTLLRMAMAAGGTVPPAAAAAASAPAAAPTAPAAANPAASSAASSASAAASASAATPAASSAAPAAARCDSGLSAERQQHVASIKRLNTLVLPPGVHLTVVNQPSLLSPAGQPLLSTLCTILGFVPGQLVEPASVRKTYLRLSKSVHPDKASSYIDETSRRRYVSTSEMEVAMGKITIANNLLKELTVPFTVPAAPAPAPSAFAGAAGPSRSVPSWYAAAQQKAQQDAFARAQAAAQAAQAAAQEQAAQQARADQQAWWQRWWTNKFGMSSGAAAGSGTGAAEPAAAVGDKRRRSTGGDNGGGAGASAITAPSYASFCDTEKSKVAAAGFTGGSVQRELGRRWQEFKAANPAIFGKKGKAK